MGIVFSRYIKPYVKPFLILFAIYSVAMLSIWRVDVPYVDDMRRAISGNAWSYEFNRYSQSWLSYLLNMAPDLTDISPLPQIVAMAFLSVSGIIVTYLFCGQKIKYLPLILSAFIGLSPFLISCWLYKFDAPGMAMSIMVSVIPLLFWYPLQKQDNTWQTGNDKKLWLWFLLVSATCLMVMWTSYQASSGVYLAMVAGLAFRDFLDRQKLKQIFRNIAFYAAAYLLAALIFRFVLPAPGGYRGTDMPALPDMLPVIGQNTAAAVNFVISALNVEWKILITLVFLCFLISLIIFSKRRKAMRLLDAAAGIAFIFILLPASYGAFLLLSDFWPGVRDMGNGLVFAVLGMLTCRNIADAGKEDVENGEAVNKLRWRELILTLPALMFLYSCIVYSLTLGNALSDQQRWGNFRTETLLADLARFYPDHDEIEDIVFQINGDIGLSAVSIHVNDEYPVTKWIISHSQHGLGGDGGWSLFMIRFYYEWGYDFSMIWDSGEWDYSLWEVKLDSYYHTIRDSGDGRVHIKLK